MAENLPIDPVDRFDVERMLSALVGGASPSDEETIVFGVEAWLFKRILLRPGGAVKGDIVYFDASLDLVVLPIGTTGQQLTVSAGGIPSWV